MQALTITRHNARILARLPRAAQAADKRQFALLEKQAAIWNRLNDVLKETRGQENRTPMLLLMSTILQAVDAGIEQRNAEFKAAAEAAGIWNKSAPKRTPKSKRRAPKSPTALAQVLKLRKAFRALPKAA